MSNRIYRNLGTVAMVPKGEYDETAYYEKLNVVIYNNSSYMAKESVHGENPSTSSKWQLIGGGVTREEIEDKKLYYDAKIGTKQNADLQTYTTYGDYIDFGEPNEPPLIDEIKYKGFDIIGHFYNDFGLKSTAMSPTQDYGSWIWYDWSWDFPNVSDYDPSRVPLLGYYQGDDRKTLDWILYWLGKAGINVLSLVNPNGINMTNWSEQSNPFYWEYVLMNQCKNIKSFKILPWVRSSRTADTSEIYETYKQYLIDFITLYKNNIHTYTYNNKSYACVFVWDYEIMRGVLDNYIGHTNTVNFFKDLATEMVTLGYGGLCVISRHYGDNLGYNYLNDNLIFMKGNYLSANGATESYENYSNSDFTISDPLTVLNVATSLKSVAAHPSTLNLPGSTPELFSKILNKAIQTIIKNKLPKMLSIYNVSEWAEAGPGLIPNINDGFGYLDAVSSCQTIIETVDTNKLIEDARKNVFSFNKEFITAKKQITSISTGVSTIEFSELAGVFNYQDSQNNYIFLTSLQTASDVSLSDVSVTVSPNFGSGRIYVKLLNTSGSSYADLTNTYINLMIIKRNKFPA